MHASELARILLELEPRDDISESVKELAKWIRTEYKISDDDINMFASVINEISNGEDNVDS